MVKVFEWPFTEAGLHQWERFWLAKRIRGTEHWVMLSYKRAENNSSLKQSYSTFQRMDLWWYLMYSSQIFTFLLSTYNMLLFYHFTSLNGFVSSSDNWLEILVQSFWFAVTEFSCMWGLIFLTVFLICFNQFSLTSGRPSSTRIKAACVGETLGWLLASALAEHCIVTEQ